MEEFCIANFYKYEKRFEKCRNNNRNKRIRREKVRIKRTSRIFIATCIILGNSIGAVGVGSGIDYYLIKDGSRLIHMSVEDYKENFKSPTGDYYQHFLKNKYLKIEYLSQKRGTDRFSDDKYVYVNDFLKSKTSNSESDSDVMNRVLERPFEGLKNDLYTLTFENGQPRYKRLEDAVEESKILREAEQVIKDGGMFRVDFADGYAEDMLLLELRELLDEDEKFKDVVISMEDFQRGNVVINLEHTDEGSLLVSLNDQIEEAIDGTEEEMERQMIDDIKKLELFFVRDEHKEDDKSLYKYEYINGTIFNKELNKNWHTPAKVEKIEIRDSKNRPDRKKNILDSVVEIDLYFVGHEERRKTEIYPEDLKLENKIRNFKYTKGNDLYLPIIFNHNGKDFYYGSVGNTNTIGDLNYESTATEYNTYIARLKFEYGNTLDIGLSTEFKVNEISDSWGLEELELGR